MVNNLQNDIFLGSRRDVFMVITTKAELLYSIRNSSFSQPPMEKFRRVMWSSQTVDSHNSQEDTSLSFIIKRKVIFKRLVVDLFLTETGGNASCKSGVRLHWPL